jgi:hypothetical protein
MGPPETIGHRGGFADEVLPSTEAQEDLNYRHAPARCLEGAKGQGAVTVWVHLYVLNYRG